MENKVAVLSRYKEINNFWFDLLSKDYNVIVYNKNEGENLLPNIGREGHTFVNYIIENYNNLPDEILFSQYDPIDHFSKNKKIYFGDAMNIFLKKNLLDFCGINSTDFDLIVRSRKIDWINFSKELFGKFELNDIHKLIAYGSTLYGVFRLSKEAVLRHDIDFYKKALEMLSRGVDPYEGYYFERMWKFIFLQVGVADKTYESFNDKVFMFGTNDQSSKIKTAQWKFYHYGHIKLSKDGTIRSNGNCSYYHHFNESHWVIKNNYLYLMDACGAATSRFAISNDGNYFIGDFKNNSGNWDLNRMKLSPPFMADI
jgi:hypothetical protein